MYMISFIPQSNFRAFYRACPRSVHGSSVVESGSSPQERISRAQFNSLSPNKMSVLNGAGLESKAGAGKRGEKTNEIKGGWSNQGQSGNSQERLQGARDFQKTKGGCLWKVKSREGSK